MGVDAACVSDEGTIVVVFNIVSVVVEFELSG